MRTLLFSIPIYLSLVSAIYGQQISFGVIGGTALTSNFLGRYVNTTGDSFGNPASQFQFVTGPKSFIFGASIEARLSGSFSIEANVLRRPMNRTIIDNVTFPDGSTRIYTDTSIGVKAWEFPVMLKYTLPSVRFARFRPFLTAGPSFRTQEDASSTEPSRFGASLGAGAAFQLGRMRIATGLRYTRWASETIYPRYATKPDQLEFLTSLAFQTDPLTRRLAGRGLELGAIAGMPFTSAFGPVYGDTVLERTRYLAGLTAQVHVIRNLSVEIDGIYKPLRAGSDTPDVQVPFSVVTWQFPVLAKYGWTRSTWRPFVEAGPSFRLAGNLNGYNPSHYGITVGGGVETRTHGVRLSPAMRYTRWASDVYPYGSRPGVSSEYPRTNANSVELLFGVSF